MCVAAGRCQPMAALEDSELSVITTSTPDTIGGAAR